MNTIRQFEAKDISAISEAQCLAWQMAFKGILPDESLQALSPKGFADGWVRILTELTEEEILLVVEENGRPFGCLYSGPARDKAWQGNSAYELFSIYVHPGKWGTAAALRLLWLYAKGFSEWGSSRCLYGQWRRTYQRATSMILGGSSSPEERSKIRSWQASFPKWNTP